VFKGPHERKKVPLSSGVLCIVDKWRGDRAKFVFWCSLHCVKNLGGELRPASVDSA